MVINETSSRTKTESSSLKRVISFPSFVGWLLELRATIGFFSPGFLPFIIGLKPNRLQTVLPPGRFEAGDPKTAQYVKGRTVNREANSTENVFPVPWIVIEIVWVKKKNKKNLKLNEVIIA